jgi:hypothetical protein
MANKSIAAGIWHTWIVPEPQCGALPALQKGDPNVQNRHRHLRAVDRIFARLMALIDSRLEASTRISARNGDLPYIGL